MCMMNAFTRSYPLSFPGCPPSSDALTPWFTTILVDTTKKLYRRFRRYGVYEWSDVKSLAKNKPDGAVMAFRFGHTEVFEHVVSLARIRALASAAGVDHLVLQSPFRIESAAFDAIYSDGVRASA